MFWSSRAIGRAVLSFAPLIVLTTSHAAAPKPTVGIVTSEFAFAVEDSRISGNASVLDGETVTSANLPSRLNLLSGSELVIGIGSQVVVSDGRLRFRGGSLDLIETGNQPLLIEAAGLLVSPRGKGTKMSLYTENPHEVTVSVKTGQASILTAEGTLIDQLAAGQLVTFAETQGGSERVRTDAEHAPLRIARIQAQQLKHMSRLGDRHPGIQQESKALWTTLAGASGGLLAVGALSGEGGDTPGLGTIPAIAAMAGRTDPGAVRAATDRVGDRMQGGGFTGTGCGQGCTFPLVTTNAFFGWVVGTPITGFNCIFCFTF